MGKGKEMALNAMIKDSIDPRKGPAALWETLAK
jgi:hypothetical protein